MTESLFRAGLYGYITNRSGEYASDLGVAHVFLMKL